MEKEWSADDLKEIASQLGNPRGENGIKTADRMADNNANMTTRTIEMLDIQGTDRILEIGHGNASHLPQVLDNMADARYYGIDISATMIEEATRLNGAFVETGRASFTLSDGRFIPFDDAFFDKIFTVNTLYFWQEPQKFANEIFRVLKPGGLLVLTITDKSFMEKLPFTQYGFHLYDRPSAEKVVTGAGFGIAGVIEEIDVTTGMMGRLVERDIIIIIIIRAIKAG